MLKSLTQKGWSVTTVALASLAMSFGALTIVHSDAEAERPETSPAAPIAMPVDARAIEFQTWYRVNHAFSGQVEASRTSTLGFDSTGRLAQVVVDEGDHVAAGDVLAELDTDRLDAKRAELIAARGEAEARLALATATLKRLRGVIEQGGVSRQGLDEARESQRTARAALLLAEQRIASIDVDLAKARLLAPYSGTVTGRLADEGRVLAAGEPVLRLQEDGAPEIRIGIAGKALDNLELGGIYPLDSRDRTIQAELRALLPMRNGMSRTVDALFVPTDQGSSNAFATDRPLLPGDTITVHLESQVQAHGAWVPMTALAAGERGLWSLYIVQPLDPANPNASMQIQRRTVDVLHQTEEQVYVRGDLGAEDVVVQRGLHRIVPGQTVVIADTDSGASS